MQYKDLLKKKMFQESVRCLHPQVMLNPSGTVHARSHIKIAHTNGQPGLRITTGWVSRIVLSPSMNPDLRTDNVEFSSSSWKCRSGSFFELKSSFPDKIIATSAELLGTESKVSVSLSAGSQSLIWQQSAKCTLYLDDEALAMQDVR